MELQQQSDNTWQPHAAASSRKNFTSNKWLKAYNHFPTIRGKWIWMVSTPDLPAPLNCDWNSHCHFVMWEGPWSQQSIPWWPKKTSRKPWDVSSCKGIPGVTPSHGAHVLQEKRCPRCAELGPVSELNDYFIIIIHLHFKSLLDGCWHLHRERIQGKT